MGLFRSSSKKSSSTTSKDPLTVSSPSPQLKSSRSNSITSLSSQASKSINGSNGKIKSIFNKKSQNTDDLDLQKLNLQSSSPSPSLEDANLSEIDLISQRIKKRVSTIEEVNSEAHSTHSMNDEDDDDSGYTSDEVDEYDDEDDSDEEDEEDDDYEEDHSHYIKMKSRSQSHSKLNSLMSYCGLDYFVSNKQQLSALANQESKRTFSLLDESCKISQISPQNQSIINERQITILESLRTQILQLKSEPLIQQYQMLQHHKTLFERFGVIKDILGKGSYGIIKIIDPNPNQLSISMSDHKLYAVKQFQNPNHKKSPKDFEKFIDKILSEFIISCTLNSKHLVKTVDLTITLPELTSLKPSLSGSVSPMTSPDLPSRSPSPLTINSTTSNLLTENYYFSQVMECNQGGSLFAYLANTEEYPLNTMMKLDEIDCFIKQIAKGLHYMHKHGVAHCDLKLENILINYKKQTSSKHGNHHNHDPKKVKVILKISDFGRSYVFKSKWDKGQEQLVSKQMGPIGSLPYISPEEYDLKSSKTMSLSKKDCWAFGVLIFVMFNIRKYYYNGQSIDNDDNDDEDEGNANQVVNVFPWNTTELKHHHHIHKDQMYKDKSFNEYAKKRLISAYEDDTKEWLIQREGGFTPIETLFNKIGGGGDIDDLCQIRRMVIYKLLDIDPNSRLNINHFLRSDWMESIENCS
ncbi:kinase-like domain-containing protein [Scheffersomyces coipomensis]|uniref:kinase-like domain-containing protein n=1 Tax=Scheffersomyces coipomensis TaxID=1788519 RepID=UPI00315C9146